MEENDINTHVIAVTGIVEKDGKYLLAKRSVKDLQAGGEWSIPGGKVDLDIGVGILELTLQKEIGEEVGIEIEDKVDLIYNDAFVRVSGHHVVMLTFLCKYKSGEAKALEDQEEIRWVSWGDLENMWSELPEYTKRRFEALKKFIKK